MRDLCCLVLVVLTFGLAPVAQADEANLEAAREYFFDGQDFANEGRWEEARERFKKSLALKRSAITLYSLGVAELESGHLVEALESLRAFLAEPQTEATEPFVEPAEKAVAALEARVPRVTLRLEPPGLADLVVTLDGDELPEGIVGQAVLANPGEHRLSVRARGHQVAERQFALSEGAAMTLQVVLVPEPVATREPPPASSAESDVPAAPIGFLIGGAATLIVATGLGAAALSEAQQAPSAEGAEADGARAKGLAADVLFGVGGAATLVGIIYLAVELTADDQPSVSAIRLRHDGLTVSF